MKQTFYLSDDMKNLIKKYPYLNGRNDAECKPKHKIIVRMLDRNINSALNGKPGIKPDRNEELTVTFHTAGQDVLWTAPIITILEDSQILKEMDPNEVKQLQFVYKYDNGLE
jgi:hypothetical protein